MTLNLLSTIVSISISGGFDVFNVGFLFLLGDTVISSFIFSGLLEFHLTLLFLGLTVVHSILDSVVLSMDITCSVFSFSFARTLSEPFKPRLSEIFSCTKFKSNKSEASLTCFSLPEFAKLVSNCFKHISFPLSEPDSFAKSIQLDPHMSPTRGILTTLALRRARAR